MCIFDVKCIWVMKMVYRYKDLKKMFGSNYKINKFLKENNYFKIGDGLYSDKKNNHYLEILVHKYPKAILSFESAFYYHNLTDVVPDKIYLTTNRTAGRVNDKYIHQSFAIDTYYELGKETIEFEGVNITIYDKERMLIELVKNKNSFDYDYYKEIINSYRAIKGELDVYKLVEYSNAFPNGKRYIKIINDEVF